MAFFCVANVCEHAQFAASACDHARLSDCSVLVLFARVSQPCAYKCRSVQCTPRLAGVTSRVRLRCFSLIGQVTPAHSGVTAVITTLPGHPDTNLTRVVEVWCSERRGTTRRNIGGMKEQE